MTATAPVIPPVNEPHVPPSRTKAGLVGAVLMAVVFAVYSYFTGAASPADAVKSGLTQAYAMQQTGISTCEELRKMKDMPADAIAKIDQLEASFTEMSTTTKQLADWFKVPLVADASQESK